MKKKGTGLFFALLAALTLGPSGQAQQPVPAVPAPPVRLPVPAAPAVPAPAPEPKRGSTREPENVWRDWPDTYQARLTALALMQSLNAEILASTSATRSLERWCGEQALAEVPRIVADRVRDVAKAPSAEQLARLQVTSADELRYRRVRLRCGSHVLSEADNWYVPARLTPEMNDTLTTTDAPFGRVVASLGTYRRTVSAVVLWTPLPEGWARGAATGVGGWDDERSGAAGALTIPAALFEHRAVLYTRDHAPFSEVAETYQRAVLGRFFPAKFFPVELTR